MYISEIIDLNEIKKWPAHAKILINAQTGAGKTYWMFRVLTPYFAEQRAKVLILSNRNILKLQNLESASQEIVCLNYQSIESMPIEKAHTYLRGFDVICFDECHYFFKDAVFNDKTDIVLDYILKEPASQIQIFASATPEPLLQTPLSFDFRYNIPRDYSYIKQIVLYKNISDVARFLTKKAPEEKSLIFFSDAVQAVSFYMDNKRKVSFLCSDANNMHAFSSKKTKEQIIKSNKFTKPVLASTTVLDNGVNLIDPKLRNIAIDFFDPITIIQTLGRKRVCSPDDKIVLFIKEPTKQQLYHSIKDVPLEGKRDSVNFYKTFLSAYYSQILKEGFYSFWARYFSVPTISFAAYSNAETLAEIQSFFAANIGNAFEPQEIRTILKPLAKDIQNVKVKTINELLARANLHFEVESKNKNRHKMWFIKLQK